MTLLGCIADDLTGATDLAGLLARSGVSALTISCWGIAAYTLIQVLLALNLGPWDVFLWALFGAVGTSAISVLTICSTSARVSPSSP